MNMEDVKMEETNESVRDIINALRADDGRIASTLFCYNEDGGVNLGNLIERLDRANQREMAELARWRQQALEEDGRANLIAP